MKLCYIADGKSIHVERWIGYFAEQGHEIALLTDNPGIIPNIHEISIGNKQGNKLIHYYRCVSEIKKFIQSWKPDILHGHFISGYGYWAAMTGFHPLVLTAWGSDIYILPQTKFISKILIKQALGKADLVTADSENLKSAALDLEPQTKRVEVINFGVDTTLFRTAVIEENESLMKMKSGKKLLLSNRRLETNYNVENIIRAVSLIKREFKDIRLLILGNGSQQKYLQELVKSLTLNDHVTFHDSVNQSELPSYLNLADIFISVPFKDGTSVSLLEAMSCEKPVIVSDQPSNREWIEQDKNGKLIPPTSVDELARATIELLRNPNQAQDMGKRNRQIIIDRAEYRTQMQKMEKLYKEISNL